MPKNARAPATTAVFLLILACLLSCGPKPGGEPAVATSSFFWGHWVRMDVEESWYFADAKVLRGAEELAVTAASETSAAAGGHSFARQSDNVIKADEGAFYLYRRAGAQGTASGKVVAGGAAGARALGGIASVSVVATNLRNAMNTSRAFAGADGTFSLKDIIPTDAYALATEITKADGSVSTGPAMTVTPRTKASDLGNIALTDLAYNFKVAGVVDGDPPYLLADGTWYDLVITITNVGTQQSNGAFFEFPAQDGLVVTSGADPILGTIKPYAKEPSLGVKTFVASVSCPSVLGDYEDKQVKIRLKDADSSAVWDDAVSLRFFKRTMSVNVSSVKPLYGVLLSPEKEGSWFSTTASGSMYAAKLEVPYRSSGYLLSLSRASVATECRYGVGFDTAAPAESRILALATTSPYEPNNSEDRAWPVAIGDSIVAYLHDGDIDFYAVGGKAAAPAFDPPPGDYDHPITLSLSSVSAGAVVRYTLDGTDPSDAIPPYAAPFALDSPATARARATAAGLDPSDIAIGEYGFICATPVFSAGGSGGLAITCATPGASIRYAAKGQAVDSAAAGSAYDAARPLDPAAGPYVARAFRDAWKPSGLGASSGAPAAGFSVSPASPRRGGTTSFAATATDDDTATASILVRWDFDGNGTWDSDWSTAKETTWTYALVGTYSAKLEAKDASGFVGAASKTVVVAESAAPTVSVAGSATPYTGISATYTAGVSDDDTAVSAIEVRWSYDGGQTWTAWSVSKTGSALFAADGPHTVQAEARDSFGRTATAELAVVAGPLVGFNVANPGAAFTKYGTKALLAPGSAGSWDAGYFQGQSVLLEDGTFKMWYSASNASGVWQIGYATSPDGFAWTKRAQGPVLGPGASADYDGGGVAYPCVVKEDGVYKMWFTGMRSSTPTSIGYATSSDGIAWTKYAANPVLAKSGSWETGWIGYASVAKVEGSYHLYYSAHNGNARICHATSSDGIAWTRDPANPVLNLGGADTLGVHSPWILYDGKTWHMWYTGIASAWYRIEYASSATGSGAWTRGSITPVLSRDGVVAWDNYYIWFGSPLVVDGKIWIYYGGTPSGGPYAIGLARMMQ